MGTSEAHTLMEFCGEFLANLTNLHCFCIAYELQYSIEIILGLISPNKGCSIYLQKITIMTNVCLLA